MMGMVAVAAITLSSSAHADPDDGDLLLSSDALGPTDVLQPSQYEHPTMGSPLQDMLDAISGKTTPRDDGCPVQTWQQLLLPCDTRAP